eukprot:gb/GECG01014579.1/.p1 GENE.gb/GECG01014579.1/~~gb/GECG01014579.1/.p1  ORF type:complete len:198 (+),score=4.35 gb/GECG01014579.1/:1-594(+)
MCLHESTIVHCTVQFVPLLSSCNTIPKLPPRTVHLNTYCILTVKIWGVLPNRSNFALVYFPTSLHDSQQHFASSVPKCNVWANFTIPDWEFPAYPIGLLPSCIRWHPLFSGRKSPPRVERKEEDKLLNALRLRRRLVGVIMEEHHKTASMGPVIQSLITSASTGLARAHSGECITGSKQKPNVSLFARGREYVQTGV